MIYRFSEFEFDERTLTLSDAAGEIVPLQMRARELLLLLLRNAGATVPKSTILREVWGRENVSRSALPTQVSKLRIALKDNAEKDRLIETIPRKGLRLSCPIATAIDPAGHEVSVVQDADLVLSEDLKSDLIGDSPTIAVVPFGSDSPSEDMSWLAHALPADIVIALSRLRLLRVTAYASSSLLSQKDWSPSSVKASLGVDYSLTGILAGHGRHQELRAELADTRSQEVVWSERFEINIEDIHQAREEIVALVASHIQREISKHEMSRTLIKQPESLTAWQAYHAGMTIIDRRGVHNMPHARRYFERAVAIDPTFSRAWSGIAQTHFIEAMSVPSDVRKSAVLSLARASEKALSADQNDPEANLSYGLARVAESDNEKSKYWYEQAIEIAPSYAIARQQLGTQQLFAGNPQASFEHSSAAIKLNPHSPVRFNIYCNMALAQQSMGKLEAAMEWGCKAGDAPYDEVQNLVVALCCNHLKGDSKTAQGLATRINATFPGFAWEKVYGTNMFGDAGRGMVEAILAQYGI